MVGTQNHLISISNFSLGYAYISFLRRMIFALSFYFVISSVLYMLTYCLVGIIEGATGNINKTLSTLRYKGVQEFYISMLMLALTILIVNTVLDMRVHL